MINTAKVRVALEAKLHELEHRAEEIEADLSTKPDADWEENAIESEDDEVLASVGNLTLEDIRHIKLAIGRIDSGQYQICTTCGKDIPEARLKALPHSSTCIHCAS